MANRQGVIREFLGAAGQTRTERVLYSCACGELRPVDVYRCVNAASHPDLARRLAAGELNRIECPGRGPEPVNVSVVYHDPNAGLLVLVIPESARHSELVERAELLRALAADREYPVPTYAVEFIAVFGSQGLAELLAAGPRALGRGSVLVARHETGQPPSAKAASAVVGAPRPDMAGDEREGPATNPLRLFDTADLDAMDPEAEAVDHGPEVGATALPPLPPVGEGAAAATARNDTRRLLIDDDSDDDDDHDGSNGRHQGGRGRPSSRFPAALAPTKIGLADVAVERWIVSREHDLKLADEVGVRLIATVDGRQYTALHGGVVQVRLQMHRLASYPLILVSVANPAAASTEPLVFFFDIADDADREVLTALAREFAFRLQLFDRDYNPVRETDLSANLADNARFALTAAQEHLESIAADRRSFARATIEWSNPRFDRDGHNDSDLAAYRPEVLARLETPAQVRQAVAMVARFSKPAAEEALLLIAGEPMTAWNHTREKVVRRAMSVGLWPGAELAQLAMSLGAAHSRKDLVIRLRRAFARLVNDPQRNDLRPDDIQENWVALDGESTSARDAAEDEASVVSGTIGEPALGRMPSRGERHQVLAHIGDAELSELDADELVALLDLRSQRVQAALELARRGEVRGIPGIFRVIDDLSRTEVIQVVGDVVRCGDAAGDYLTKALRSPKSYVRQAAGLALAVLKTEAGIEALCDQLLTERTSVWRELARAVGHVGPRAVMPLVARLRDLDDSGRERVAWALANVAAQGGRGPVETLAQGRNRIASGVARHALGLVELALSDDRAVRGPDTPREQTINRAFSRRFLAALRDGDTEQDVGEDGDSDERSTSHSGEALVLDDDDLIEAEADVLDESDLITT
jgi:hypothetical protein